MLATTSLRPLLRLRSLLGGWTPGARRIERALAGAAEPLTPEQADRLRRIRALRPEVVLAAWTGRPLMLLGTAVIIGVAALSASRPEPGAVVLAAAVLLLALGSLGVRVLLGLAVRRASRREAPVADPVSATGGRPR